MRTSVLSVCLHLAAVGALAQPGNDDLSADTILAKTKAAYAALSSVRLEGQVKHPWASLEAAPLEARATLAPLASVMLMARPCLYRVEAETGMAGAEGRVVSWCDGKAHHQFYGRAARRIETADQDQYDPQEFAYALPEGIQELQVPPRRRPAPRQAPPPGNPTAAPAAKP